MRGREAAHERGEKDLLDHLDHIVFVIEPDALGDPRYAHVNRLACQALGCVLEDVVGKTARDLFPPPIGEASFTLHRNALSNGTTHRYEIFKPLRGTTTLIPQRDERGQVARLIASTRSLDAPSIVLGVAESRQARLNDLRRFVYLAAHDLRTPMRQVVSISESLRDETDPLERAELLSMLDEVTRSALDLIGGLLEHASVTGTAEDISLVSLSDLITSIAAMLDPHHTIALDFVPCAFEMDRSALQVVLRNLFDNAVKHAWSDADAARRISVTVCKGEGTLLEFTFEDNGCGLSELQRAVFNGEREGASGKFGVAAIRSLLQHRGGWLHAEKWAQGGTRIRFALPGALDTRAG